MNNKKKCFVIMPFSKTQSCTADEWAGIFEHMIKPTVTGSKLGFDCDRAKPRTGAFIKDILDCLNRADVVIADLTDKNPNVFYELGIRHTLKNRTLLITQNIKHVPSDLRSYWVVTYRKDLTGANEFRKKVREILREMQKDPDKSDSPVADFLHLKNIDIVAYERAANLKRLSALIFELSRNLQLVEPILTTCQQNQVARQQKKPTSIMSAHFENHCLELLASSWYIMLDKELLDTVARANRAIASINNRLSLWAQQSFADSVEKSIIESFPGVKQTFEYLLKDINKIRIDYVNNNYQEPETPAILLASPEHEKYLKITK